MPANLPPTYHAAEDRLRRAVTQEEQDLAAHFKFARLWGAHVFDGQRVQASHPLEEGDVVEIHV